MGSLLFVKAKNFRNHAELNVQVDGKSILLIGDSGEGKSNFAEIIRAGVGLDPFPKNALKEGETEGEVEVGQIDEHGLVITTRRTFTEHGISDRYKITDNHGGKYDLKSAVSKLLSPVYISRFFDWDKFFNKTKGPAERTEYILKRIPDERIPKNVSKIAVDVKEREIVGRQRKIQEAALDENGMNGMDPEILEKQIESYLEEKDPHEIAKVERDQFLHINRINVEAVQITKELYEDIVRKQEMNANAIALKEARIKEITELVKTLNAEKKTLNANIKIMQNQIADLDPNAKYAVIEHEKIIKEAIEANIETEKEAEQLFEDKIREVIEWNNQKRAFFTGLDRLSEFNRLDKEYEDLTDGITKMREENLEIFKASLPLPELSLSEDNVILYNGREFSLDNISTGESIKIAVEIQRALNPGGTNLVMVPHAESLGSKLDEVLKLCKEFNIQCIVEMTERNSDLEIIVTDDALKSLDERADLKASTTKVNRKATTKKK